MRSSLILEVTLLLTIAATSIVQARTIKSEHTCGSLGPGTNACKCGEVVVKATKVQKPLVYASPEAINEAAIAREAIGRFSGPGHRSMLSNAIYNPYKGIVSASSSSHSTSSSSSSSSGLLGRLIGGSYYPYNLISNDASSDSGCGCGKKSEPLEASDLLSSDTNKQIVPSFPPIGDLCYPSKVEKNGKLQVTTKVTPAYPSKITCHPPTPEQVCVNVLNGQIDAAEMKKLGLTTASASTASGVYTYRHSGNTQYGNLGRYSSSSSLGGYDSSGSVGGYSSTGYNAGYGSGYAGYAGSQVGTMGQVHPKTSYRLYGNKFRTLSDEFTQGSTGSYRSNCDDFDNSELPEDYSYPQIPADPVSLTLAYKNLFPHITYYQKKGTFVPEDKLAFGHRTIPTETASSKKRLDVPEEKLQILDKPVVELKPISSVPITVGSYDEQEEAKLAELEAIERERINQEEIAEQPQGNYITYGDLGYAPINGALTKKWSNHLSVDSINTLDAEDSVGGCAAVGPPAPDYVPGSVVINREITTNEDEVEDDIQKDVVYGYHYEDDARSDEEDDGEDSTSGIFARLRSSAQKYGLPCGIA